ncbi:Mco1p [Halocaridina rubra]|uniref:Mco1p n=1 Tax=Halocaridina rubra TaxID=373956 RepID=A0AAN8WJ44_HALRR
MAMACQLSAIAAITMVALVLAAAIATLTSVITAQEPPTPGKNCYRRCMPGDARVCHFSFEVHLYQILSRACYNCPRNATDCARSDCIAGDGIKRRIIAINKQMPGPAMQVCEGDKVVVDVKNSLPAEGITMHWHGITQSGSPALTVNEPPSGTPYMDGVPGITQCPIHAGSSFRYSFYAHNVGTHWYHAHSGFHRGDGVFGALIVRRSLNTDPNVNAYDHDLPEHTILVTDWLHIPTEDKFALNYHGGGDDFAESILVNGQGPFQHANASDPASLVPYRRFKVTPGESYRFRLISTAILNCPITFSIDQHLLTIIESDGNPIVPINATSLVIHSGERFDFVLHPTHDKSDIFWMNFMGSVDCAEPQAHQFAFLEYERQHVNPKNFKHGDLSLNDRDLLRKLPPKPVFTEIPPEGVQVNSLNSACYDDLVCIADLRSPYSLPDDLKYPQANLTLYLAFEMRPIHNSHFYSRMFYDFELVGEDQQVSTPQINNISFTAISAPLLLNKRRVENKICNAELPLPSKNCHDDHCECVHLYEIPLGAVVDLVLIDEGQHGDESHPVHLHGYHFWVIGQHRPDDVVDAAITRSEVMAMDARGELQRNFDRPVQKDTVTVPDAGYTIIRFRADNPGFWLLHCHVLFHSVAGMELVFKVGEDHQIPEPPADFPSCGDFRHTAL